MHFARRIITFGLSLITFPDKISFRNRFSAEIIGIPKFKLAFLSNTIITNGSAALLLGLGRLFSISILLYTVGTAPWAAATNTWDNTDVQ